MTITTGMLMIMRMLNVHSDMYPAQMNKLYEGKLPGTYWYILHKLLKLGLVEDWRTDGKRYFHLTVVGRDVLQHCEQIETLIAEASKRKAA